MRIILDSISPSTSRLPVLDTVSVRPAAAACLRSTTFPTRFGRPLEWAVILGNRAASRLLLARGARVDRILEPSICFKYDLARGSTLVHLCAKLGGERGLMLEELVTAMPPTAADDATAVSSPTKLLRLLDANGASPLDVADARLARRLDARRFSCWTVLYETLLSPTFSRETASAVEGMCTRLREALAAGGDPACQNDDGWTCLGVVALALEPEAMSALLSTTPRLPSPLDDELDDEADASRQAAERLIYSTSSAGLTALLWASWMAWVTGLGASDEWAVTTDGVSLDGLSFSSLKTLKGAPHAVSVEGDPNAIPAVTSP